MSLLILQGILIGLVLSIFAGPIFFVYLQVSAEKGFRAGLAVGLGAWLGDFLYILIVAAGIGSIITLLKWDGFAFWFAVFGGIMLIIFGISTIITANNKKSKLKKDIPIVTDKNYFRLFIKGFSINFLNPFVALFWLGTMGILTALIKNDNPNLSQKIEFYGSIMIVVMITDILKIYLSKKIKKFLKSPHSIYNLQKIVGIILVVLGAILIVRGILH